MVNFAGGDVRPVAERIIDIAPQLNAAGQVGVGVHPQAVVAGVIAGFAQKVGGVAETPVTRQVETSPLGLVAKTQVGIQCRVVGRTALRHLLLSLVDKAYVLAERSAGTCGNGKSAFDALLVSHGGSCVPIPVHIHGIAFYTACLGIVRHSPCHTVHRVRPSHVSVQTYLRVSCF